MAINMIFMQMYSYNTIPQINTISQLPDEIIELIVRNIKNVKHINLVSKQFNRVVTLVDLCSSTKAKLDRCLIKASKEGNITLVIQLLNRGATVTSNSMERATEIGRIDIVKVLLDMSTKYNIKRNIYMTMIAAGKYNNMDIVKLMLLNNSDSIVSTMSSASKAGNIEIVKLLLDITTRPFGWVMQDAARYGHINIVNLLLNSEQRVYEVERINGRISDYIEYTMYTAARYGYSNIVELMVLNGATNFYESIEIAKQYNNAEVIKTLTLIT